MFYARRQYNIEMFLCKIFANSIAILKNLFYPMSKIV